MQGGQWLREETAAGFARTTAADVSVLKVGQVFAAGGTAVMLWSLRKAAQFVAQPWASLRGPSVHVATGRNVSIFFASDKNVISCVHGFSPARGRGINSLVWAAFRSSLQLAICDPAQVLLLVLSRESLRQCSEESTLIGA